MSDLIGREALMEYARNHVGHTIDCNDIARFPAVDAEPVVRCKDCKHYNKSLYEDDGVCDKIAYIMDGYYHGTFEEKKPDDFCSCGERTDGGAEDV